MHVVLFDIDGTLLSTGGAGQASMEKALRQLFGIEKIFGDIPAAGRTDRAITTELFEQHELRWDGEEYVSFCTTYFGHLETVMPTLEGMLLPGVEELLTELSSRDNVTLGLLTGNFQHAAWLKLKYFAIDHHFGFGGFGDEHHDRDDVARLAFAAAREQLGERFKDDRVWVVGDTPSDVRCGKAIGAKTVAVSTGIFSYEQLERTNPDYLFHDLTEAQPFLDALND